MTKYLISGYIGFDNFGDEAILKVLVSNLKKKGAEKITAISSNPEKTAQLYNINSVGMFDFLKAVNDTEVLISGGGSLLQDITSLKSLLYYLSIIMYAIVLNKKVIIFAQGFTPFRTKIGKFFTKFTLKNCSKIFVRDIKSQEMLYKMGISSELIADPVYGIDKIPLQEKSAVGIQLRKYPNLTEEFLENLADKIYEKFANKEIRLFSLQDTQDLEILKIFAQKLKKRGLESIIYKNLSVNDVIEKISELEYLIGMRFHSLLVGAKNDVKLLGINYDIKVENLAKVVKFPIIDLSQKDIDKEFEDLINLQCANYQIPSFIFPEI